MGGGDNVVVCGDIGAAVVVENLSFFGGGAFVAGSEGGFCVAGGLGLECSPPFDGFGFLSPLVSSSTSACVPGSAGCSSEGTNKPGSDASLWRVARITET